MGCIELKASYKMCSKKPTISSLFTISTVISVIQSAILNIRACMKCSTHNEYAIYISLKIRAMHVRMYSYIA